MDHPTPEIAALYDELKNLLKRLRVAPRETADVARFLQVHAADLKHIVKVDASNLLWRAVDAGHVDVMLALLDAGARPVSQFNTYHHLMFQQIIYDLNGHVLEDAAVAARLRIMHDTHGLRLPQSDFVSDATFFAVSRHRPECLRVMVEIDPRARGYTSDTHNSLLHDAAAYNNLSMLRFLLENWWSVDSHDLNNERLSPLAVCMLRAESEDPLNAMSDKVAILLQDVQDAASAVRSSGLCDMPPFKPSVSGCCRMPRLHAARMHVYVCAAVRVHSALPRRALYCTFVAYLVEHSPGPGILRALPLDVHVHTGIGDPIYLRDSLRVASSFDSAARYAAAVDALCVVEARKRGDPDRWDDCTCMRVLRESGETTITGVSPTLQHWAWMRRLHAVTARQQLMRQEAARRFAAAAMRA